MPYYPFNQTTFLIVLYKNAVISKLLKVSGGSRWSPDYNLVISPVMAGDAGEYRYRGYW